MARFRLEYDTSQEDGAFSAISAANEVLSELGISLNIDSVDGGDGWTEYEITKEEA